MHYGIDNAILILFLALPITLYGCVSMHRMTVNTDRGEISTPQPVTQVNINCIMLASTTLLSSHKKRPKDDETADELNIQKSINHVYIEE